LKNQILICRDDFSKVTGVSNPSKDATIDALGHMRGEISELLAKNVS
jgi:hypothetical protein